MFSDELQVRMPCCAGMAGVLAAGRWALVAGTALLAVEPGCKVAESGRVALGGPGGLIATAGGRVALLGLDVDVVVVGVLARANRCG